MSFTFPKAPEDPLSQLSSAWVKVLARFLASSSLLVSKIASIDGTPQSSAAIAHIVEIARQKPFADVYDFCDRVSDSVNKRAAECLIRAGALDSLPGSRSQKVLVFEKAMDAYDQLDDQYGAMDAAA